MTATGIVAPNVRDLPALGNTLSAWLSAQMPAARDIQISNLSYPLGAGMSHETILFDAEWREGSREQQRGLVVRIKPTGVVLYLDDMFEAQYAAMRLLHADGRVRVAAPLWFEPRSDILGAPFFVMEKIAGRVPVSYPPYSRQGWLFDATPSQRRRAWEEAVTQLALIQTVPNSDATFLTLPGGVSGFDQEIDRWRRYLAYVDPDNQYELLRNCFDRLLARPPQNRRDGILWGDARLGNMMFGADFSVTAVMDWEAPSLGGGLHDLGWWLISDSVQTTLQGIDRLDGMGSRDETLVLWSEVSGCPTDDITWYEAFAFLKMELTGVRLVSIRDVPGQRKGQHVPGAATARLLDSLS